MNLCHTNLSVVARSKDKLRVNYNRKETSERNFGMSKYIIKNCPYYSEDETLDGYENMLDCQNITDCLLKQIVEKCLNGLDFSIFKGVDGCYSERGILAKEILQLLDIQEVE